MRYLARMLVWIRSWFVHSRVTDRMSALELKVTKLRGQKNDIDNRLTRHLRQAKQWEADIEKATELNKRMNLALETALQEIENSREITIPGLVAANKTLISRWEAEVQVHAMNAARLKAGASESME